VSLKFGVLGLLAEEPLHGYEVKNRFEAMLGGTWEVNIGQVYTTLQRLERDGLVRPVGARGDRGRLQYELSASGRKKRAYLQRLRDLNRLEERARRDGRTDLARLVRGALLHTEADIKWIDELSETATSGDSK
jgi:DNA-binding PadR family transcriptional regulator